MNFGARILLTLVIISFSLGMAHAEQTAKTPAPLTPWVDWVLYGHEEELLCPPSYNDASALHCDWPSRLEINATDLGATFRQQWLVQHERWLQLPGDTDHWPTDVKVNGQTALVMNREGAPKIRVESGSHEISGRLQWSTLPEYLTLPAHTGLVSLILQDQGIDFPNLDSDSRLWLQASRPQTEKVENSLSLQTFRLLDDTIPARIVTLLKVDSGGAAREVVLGPVFSPGQLIPLSLTSDLPARLEPDGRLRVQVRPGQWSVRLTARQLNPLTSYQGNQPDDGSWPSEEIVSFQAHPDLRAVELSGATPIDPTQTAMPEEWRTFPAYRISTGAPGDSGNTGTTLQIKETRRGAAQPPPDQLSLQRELWLHFDGSGYTIQDTINGQKNNGWRLEMAHPIILGRAVVNNQEQFITKQTGSDKAGVEIREGQLQLMADSTYPAPIPTVSTLPATGWDIDFHKVTGVLNLPPGWKLVNATGIDSIADTWVARWSLLDFFLVIIFTLAVARLYANPPLTVIAFLSYTLSYQESGAPRWVWLALLIGVALLRHLPAGRFREVIKVYQAGALLILISIAIPFAINQLRVGIYPQLEKPYHTITPRTEQKAEVQLPRAQPAPTPMTMNKNIASLDGARDKEAPLEETVGSMAPPSPKLKGSPAALSSSYQSQVVQYDPTMIQQTGPGLPAWRWNQVAMSWSGPVQRDQLIRLTLIGPRVNLALAFVRVALMSLLAVGMLGITWRRGKGWNLPDWKTVFIYPLLLGCLYSPGPAQAGEIPTPEMFEQLRARLLEKADCFPDCADVSTMAVTISPESLTLNMTVDSQLDGAIPLPGNAHHWLPQQVMVDNKPASALLRIEQQLWLLTPAGRHQIRLQGKIPKQNSIQLPLPLRPHHITTEAQGWSVEGVNDGLADNQLLFKRIVDTTDQKDNSAQILETGILPPFVLIERTLLLGLTWKVETRISRISPSGSAIVLSVPLLPGESVVTEGVRVEDGQAKVNLDAESGELRWESVLDKSDQLLLKHPDTDQWTEIWRVDVSPIYHLTNEGIPVILHQQGSRWYPTWHPWPGDEVKLLISRPTGVAGQTLTIDQSLLQVRPGKRATDSTLQLSIRSSQGGQHTITLPATAQLQKATINGSVQQLRQEGTKISLPITPGKQEVSLEWREPSGLSVFYTTPRIDLGAESVNAAIEMSLPQNRWPLFLGGPLMGPAILYWSTLLVVVLVALALSKTGLTPLRFYQLLLLGIGMSMSNLFSCLLVVGWLIALHFRRKIRADIDRNSFNLTQFGLGTLTILAMISLIWAISQGLLGHPDMNIIGNGSNSSTLRWYQDGSGQHLPTAWLISIPMLAYRLAMLAWALWISLTLLRLLQWGWKIMSEPKLWDSSPRKKGGKDTDN